MNQLGDDARLQCLFSALVWISAHVREKALFDA
ncbi:MAG: hypothetical protein RL710_3297 [Pseudomonadota bacterium]|jgi:hypothetical protein